VIPKSSQKLPHLPELGRRLLGIITFLRGSIFRTKSMLLAIHDKALAHPLAKSIAGKLIGWAIIGFGIAIAQWDEYGLALGLFLGGSIVLLLQAYNWKGFEGYESLSKALRFVYVLVALVMLIGSYPIINYKRADKPWSDALYK
jgi:hypothetical protein